MDDILQQIVVYGFMAVAGLTILLAIITGIKNGW